MVGAAVLLTRQGCGTTKPTDWQADAPPPPPADLLAGQWEGTWASDSKPLKGKLSAGIEKLPNGDYRASFTSEAGFGITDRSVCTFHVTPGPNLWTFAGKENMGILKGGTYTYQGTVDGSDFVCTYDSTFDKGTFRMRRGASATATGPASRNNPAE